MAQSHLYRQIYESQFGKEGADNAKDIRKPFRYPKIPLKSNEGGRKRAKAKDTKGTLRRIWSYVAEKKGF